MNKLSRIEGIYRTMAEPERLDEHPISSRRARTLIILLLLISGGILGSFVLLVFAMHHAFASDGWPSVVNQAFGLFETLWVLALIVACVLLVSIFIRRGEKTRTLWIALVVAGVANLASSWWYLYMTSQNSMAKVPIRTWIVSALPCCLWIVAAAVKCSDTIKTDDYERFERRRTSRTSEDDDDIIQSSVKEPLIERV
jgi:magnesium-transporting ATPase (P-type)